MTTINLYTLWTSLLSEANVQQNGQIRPGDFQRWVNKVNENLFRKRVATDELAQLYTDDLIPFKNTINVAVVPLSGRPYDQMPYPANYQAFANLRILRVKDTAECACDNNYPLYQNKDGACQPVVDEQYAAMQARWAGKDLAEITVNKVDAQRWGSCMQHPTKGPTFDEPKATQISTQIYIAPKGVTSVLLDYYSTPRSCVFAYTIGPGDVVIYDPVNSIQLQWSTSLMPEFLDELKKIYAAAIGDQNLYQTSNNDAKMSV